MLKRGLNLHEDSDEESAPSKTLRTYMFIKQIDQIIIKAHLIRILMIYYLREMFQ
jgi:hypothetical protein